MSDTFTVTLGAHDSEIIVESHGFRFVVADARYANAGDGHETYRYAIYAGDDMLCEREDLRSGVQGSDVVQMFGSLCTFLGSWEEARTFDTYPGGADPESLAMFPESLAPVADAIGDGFSVLASDVAVEILKQRAAELGRDAGHAAGTWVFDGNTSTDPIRRVLKGIEDGDPMILDELPGAPLSGEYAGDPTPDSVMDEIGADELREMIGADDVCDVIDDVCDAYEESWQTAMVDEVQRSGRAVL